MTRKRRVFFFSLSNFSLIAPTQNFLKQKFKRRAPPGVQLKKMQKMKIKNSKKKEEVFRAFFSLHSLTLF